MKLDFEHSQLLHKHNLMKKYEQHYESKQKHWLKHMGDENKANYLVQKF